MLDDEEHILLYYTQELTEAGHEVYTANSGAGLIDRIESIAPDVIVLDIKFPDDDGLELLQQVRAHYGDLPVILSSAYDSFQHTPAAIAADYYVVKSFNLDKLMLAIDRAVEASAAMCA